jgi:hypothetical protein
MNNEEYLNSLSNLINLYKYDISELYAVFRKELQACSIILYYLDELDEMNLPLGNKEGNKSREDSSKPLPNGKEQPDRGFFKSQKRVIHLFTSIIKKELDGDFKELFTFDFRDPKDSKNRYSPDEINSRFWRFYLKRSNFLADLRKHIGSLGIIRKGLSQRLSALPPILPPPPLSRQIEVYDSFRMIDELSIDYVRKARNITDAIFLKLTGRKPTDYSLNIVPTWDYYIDEKYELLRGDKFSNKGIKEETGLLLKTSYLLPFIYTYQALIAHEVAHEEISRNKTGLYDYFNVNAYYHIIQEHLQKNYRDVYFQYFLQDFIEEIFADIFALNVAGMPYVFAFFFNALKYDFSEKINWSVPSFSFVRMRLLNDFSKRLLGDSPIKFNSMLDSFFTSYRNFLTNPQEDIFDFSRKDLKGLFLTRLNIEDMLYESLNTYFKDNVAGKILKSNSPFQCRTDLLDGFSEKIKKAFLDKASYNITYNDIESAGIKDVSDIHNVVLYYIFHDLNSKKMESERQEPRHPRRRERPIGRLTQNLYRLMKDQETVEDKNEEVQFSFGNMVEFLFLNILNYYRPDENSKYKYIPLEDVYNYIRNLRIRKKKNKPYRYYNSNQKRFNYHCISMFDHVIISTPYSTKELIENWPPDITLSKVEHPKDKKPPYLKYYPKSEIYQEIILEDEDKDRDRAKRKGTDKRENRNTYARNLPQFLEKHDGTIVSYHIKFRNSISLQRSISILRNILEQCKLPDENYFFLDSFGWEDIILLLKITDRYTLRKYEDVSKTLMKSRSNPIHSSITHIFCGECKEERATRLDGVKILTSIRIKEYELLAYKGRFRHIFGDTTSITTGIYDCCTVFEGLETVGQFFDALETIYKHKNVTILDTYSRLLLDWAKGPNK